MLGIPDSRVISTRRPDGSPDTKVGPALLAINRISMDEIGRRPPELEGKRLDDWFIGRIDPECGIDNIEGMSGGPIDGFRMHEGKMYYHVVAVQSRWWAHSRTVFGCSLTRFAEAIHQSLRTMLQELLAELESEEPVE